MINSFMGIPVITFEDFLLQLHINEECVKYSKSCDLDNTIFDNLKEDMRNILSELFHVSKPEELIHNCSSTHRKFDMLVNLDDKIIPVSKNDWVYRLKFENAKAYYMFNYLGKGCFYSNICDILTLYKDKL